MLLLKSVSFNFAAKINITLFTVQPVSHKLTDLFLLKILSYSNFNQMKSMVFELCPTKSRQQNALIDFTDVSNQHIGHVKPMALFNQPRQRLIGCSGNSLYGSHL